MPDLTPAEGMILLGGILLLLLLIRCVALIIHITRWSRVVRRCHNRLWRGVLPWSNGREPSPLDYGAVGATVRGFFMIWRFDIGPWIRDRDAFEKVTSTVNRPVRKVGEGRVAD